MMKGDQKYWCSCMFGNSKGVGMRHEKITFDLFSALLVELNIIPWCRWKFGAGRSVLLFIDLLKLDAMILFFRAVAEFSMIAIFVFSANLQKVLLFKLSVIRNFKAFWLILSVLVLTVKFQAVSLELLDFRFPLINEEMISQGTQAGQLYSIENFWWKISCRKAINIWCLLSKFFQFHFSEL